LLENRPIFVTLGFYDTFHAMYPNCTQQDLRLHELLLLTGRYDPSGGIVCSSRVSRQLFGKVRIKPAIKQWSIRNSVPVRVVKGSSYTGRATVLFPTYPNELADAAVEERVRIFIAKDWRSDLVDFRTGAPCTDNYLRKAREHFSKQISQQAVDSAHPAHDLLVWLNSMPTKGQTKLLKRNMSDVARAILQLPRGKMIPRIDKHGEIYIMPDKDRARYDHNARVLAQMVAYPFVKYKDVDGTPRLYANGLSPLGFSRDIRAIAYDGCWYLDLKSVQLCVLSALSRCERLQSYLATGGSWWDAVLQPCGLSMQYKPTLKIGTYSLSFGAGEGYIRYLLSVGDIGCPGLTRKQVDSFLANEYVAELLKGRNQLLSKIEAEGGMTDAFSRFISLSSTGIGDTEKAARSVLACVCQSYELRIMMAVVDVIKSYSHTNLMGWLHDGVIVSIRRNESVVIRDMRTAVLREIRNISQHLGVCIHTRLEAEKLCKSSATVSLAA